METRRIQQGASRAPTAVVTSFDRDIESIEAKRVVRRRGVPSYKEYSIHWKGLPESEKPWESVSMDFISALPLSHPWSRSEGIRTPKGSQACPSSDLPLSIVGGSSSLPEGEENEDQDEDERS